VLARPEYPTGGWIVARTKPRQETYAQENVIRQGYSTYLPRCIDTRTERVSVLFPGYLFVCAYDSWSWLRNTYGILDVVAGTAGGPARVPDKEFHRLKQREDADGFVHLPLERFRPNQRVRLNWPGSAYNGMLGLYAGISGAERVRVLLNMLGAYTPTEVEDCFVEMA
jgi:transcriptional antiterminator RfaH